MSKRKPVRMFYSVFTRLLVVILVTGLFINILVFAFFRHYIKDVVTPAYGKNFVQYSRFLIAELGAPPSRERALELADRLGLKISYQGPAGSWSTAAPGEPAGPFWKSGESFYHEDGAVAESRRGWHRVTVTQADGSVYTVSSHPAFHGAEGRGFHLAVLLLLLSFFLGGGYWVLRRILAPIRSMSEGVRAVSEGNLAYRVPQKGRDELAELADSFNVMTERVAAMIQTREQLLLDVSHELRTPITRMKVAVEFLEAGKARESIQEDLLELEAMITEILETARLRSSGADSIQRKQTDLAALLYTTAEPFVDQPPGIDLDAVAGAVVAMVDPRRIGIVFRNLLSNAQKFSRDASDPVCVRLTQRGREAVIEFVDRGVGIPQNEIPHIFEPFYRVDKSRTRATGGFGLGLSLCKTIMDAHGGRIEVASRFGKGTTVTLIIPV